MDKIKDILSNIELDKMKDEIPNDTIIIACFLKTKSYCYTTVKCEEEKKFNGITKTTLKNQNTIEDHKNAIYNTKSKHVAYYTNDSRKHHTETKKQYKKAIEPFDDKSLRGSCGSFMLYGK